MRFGKTEISPGFFLILAALIYFDTDSLYFCALAAAVLHEMIHILFIRMKGGSIDHIRLTAFGAEINLMNTYKITYLGEVLVYLSGPAANIFMAFLFSWLGNRLQYQVFFFFAGVNLVIGTFNMLPIKMLDGGNALRALCMHLFGRIPFVVQVIHTAFTAALLMVGFLFMYKYGLNLSLMAVSVYLLLGGMIEHRPVFRGLSNDPK